MRAVVIAVCCVVGAVLGTVAQTRTGTLTIYYIDTEGGQSTLFVSPAGESLLVDTGNAGDRDLGRIADTLRTAGVTKIAGVSGRRSARLSGALYARMCCIMRTRL